MSAPFYDNIETVTIQNKNYRSVVYTDENIQIVLMSLPPKSEIGTEIHQGTTQFFRIEKRMGLCIIEDKGFILNDGISFAVPPGQVHNVINTSSSKHLKLYTIYSPPHHPKGLVQKQKVD